MYQAMYEQSEAMMKQFNEILALNAEAVSALYDKQAAFVNDMVVDGIDYAKGIPSQKTVEAFYESQKDYWESVQKKIADNAKDSYDLLNETSGKITGMLQSVGSAQKAAPAKAPAKKKAAAKPVAKKPEAAPIDTPPSDA